MKPCKITIDKDYIIGKIDNNLYSSFIEHLGRAVYTGIYEPGHPLADANGFRTDVIGLVRELNLEYVRYPGGNFLSGYRWTDGIGPKAERPRRLDLAWRSTEPNTVGIDEFAKWAKKAGTRVMGAVNMGTGTAQDAADMLEYCNFPKGTYWSDLRVKNGSPEPHGIKLWCIGNEMDGHWQICHLNAEDYGKKARETIKMMKWADKSIETVVCGSSHGHMATFPEWDRIVLEHTYDLADYISLHSYYSFRENRFDYLASFMDMENFISSVIATADYVKALKRSKKTMYLSFDEWNIWNDATERKGEWPEAPELIEDRYSLLDALAFGGLGITLINRCDRIRIACLAQLVNAIAPILTEPRGRVVRQAIYYPFMLLSKLGRGIALNPVVNIEKAESRHGAAPLIHAAAVYDEENKGLNLFCLNIADEPALLEIDTRSFGGEAMAVFEHLSLHGSELGAINTFDNPEAVRIKTLPIPKNIKNVELPGLSWNVLRLKCQTNN